MQKDLWDWPKNRHRWVEQRTDEEQCATEHERRKGLTNESKGYVGTNENKGELMIGLTRSMRYYVQDWRRNVSLGNDWQGELRLLLIITLWCERRTDEDIVAEPGYLFWITDPNFSIPDPGSASASKNLSVFNPKIVSMLSDIWSIPNPEFPPIQILIPDPGVNKASDPWIRIPGSRSATLEEEKMRSKE